LPTAATKWLIAACAAICACFLPVEAVLADRRASSAAPDSFTVAAYNLENYLPADRWVDGKRVQNAMKPEESIRALTEVIATVKPDVLGIMEIGDRSHLEDLQKRLKEAGMDFPHAEWLKAHDEYRHLALLSRFPIVSRDSRGDVPFELGGKQYRIGRGILDVTIEATPGFHLRLIGAHLKSKREVPEYDQAEFRGKEAWHLKKHISDILADSPEAKILLWGDLNDTKNEYPIRELIGTRGTPNHLFDVWLRDSRGHRWTYYWSGADLYSRIDYIMASPALVPHIDLKSSGIADPENWRDASDHRMIYVVVCPTKK
jgi:endonuclease/exonuclease/phosphatase family metal-dependent hydrolase